MNISKFGSPRVLIYKHGKYIVRLETEFGIRLYQNNLYQKLYKFTHPKTLILGLTAVEASICAAVGGYIIVDYSVNRFMQGQLKKYIK